MPKAASEAAPFVRKPVLQELEARLLLSADLNPAAQDTLLAAPALQGAEFRALAEPSAPTVVTSMQVAPLHRTNELVFVDTQTPEYLKLIEQMRAAGVGDGRQIEFVLIDGSKDGIRKITDTLAQRSDLDAIHIVSHATDGAVQLGAAQLDFETLIKRAAAIKKWGDALTENGDILFYGCDLAATEQGKSLIDALARLTGADVAASDDPTGAAKKGGDWDLEFKSGTVEANVVVSLPAQGEWDHLLATYTVTNTADAGAGSLRDAITLANGNAGADTIAFNIGGGGVRTINLLSALPTISDTVTIDGSSQPGAGTTPRILLNGTGAGAGTNGLTLDENADGSIIQGLAIYGFQGHGVLVDDGDNITIRQNHIGTDNVYTTGIGNAKEGIQIQGDATGNLIGGVGAGNTVAGNSWGAFRISGNFGGTPTNNLVQGNWFGTNSALTSAFDGFNGFGLGEIDNGASNNTVGGVNAGQGNVFAYGDDDGMQVYDGGQHSTGNAILGNSIYNNDREANGDGNGIDLNVWPGDVLGNHEATANDPGDGDGGLNAPNDLLNFPTLTSAVRDGSYIAIGGSLNSLANTNFRIEFFSSPNYTANGAGYREGAVYLGATHVTTDAAGNFTFNVALAGNVPVGRYITATATRANADFTQFFETSEFSQDDEVVVAAPAGARVTGTLYEDVDGDANVVEAGTRTIAGATVRLYRDLGAAGILEGSGTDTLVAAATTDANGNYAFIGLADGTYWVAVDSKTIRPGAGLNAGSTLASVWAEQTYGDARSVINDAGATLGTSGAFYGGQTATLSDDASAASTAEHVFRAAVVGGASVTGLDAGFSFNVVTNTLAGGNADHDVANARTVQGSLRQFIQNANAIAGANAMRFVPVEAQNAASGGETWWRITVTSELPQITDAFTTLDGTAYYSTSGPWGAAGVAVRNTNTGTLGYAGAVGLGADGIAGTADDPAPLAGVARPELEIVAGPGVGIDTVDGTADDVYVGIDIQTTDVTVRRLSIHGFGHDNTLNATLSDEADIRIGTSTGTFTGSGFDGSGILIEENVLGLGPTSIANPGAGNRSVSGIVVAGPDGGTIRNNVIAWGGRFGAFLTSDSDGWTLEGNHFERNAFENTAQDALDIGNESGGTTVVRNVFFQNYGSGVDGWQGAGGNTIENNLFDGNGQGGTEPSAMRIFGTGNVIRYNEIVNSVGDGVLVVADVEWATVNWPSNGNLISRNSFNNNGGIAIDLVQEVAGAAWANNNTGDGISFNDGAADPNDANNGVDHPVILSASLSGATLTISGTAPANSTIEIYRSVAGAGDGAGLGFGEGTQYLGTTIANGAGAWSTSFNVGTLLSVGQLVSAITIDASDNTSEFGGNFTVVSGSVNVSGTVFHDVNGDAAVSVPEGTFRNVTVHLYQDDGDGVIEATDGLVATTTTDASGVYTFTGVANGSYWVVYDSKTIGDPLDVNYHAGFGINSVWAEQTYGDNWTTDAIDLAARYGGRTASTSDNASALLSSEHVARAVVLGANVSGIDAGFSFNTVTNVRGEDTDDDGAGTARMQQGSLRQFILNANAITGANEMRFVPAVATNDSGSGGNWWTINVTSALPTITGAGTTIDGTAYYSTSGPWGAAGVTVRNDNSGQVGTGGKVGTGADGVAGTGDELDLSLVERPELEISGGNSFVGAGIAIDGASATVRDIAINGFAGGIFGQVDVSAAVTTAGQATISGNLVGVNADGTDAGSTELVGIKTNGAVTITNNYIAYIENNGVMMSDAWQGPAFRNLGQVNVVDNEIAFTRYIGAFTGDAVSDVPDGALIRGNYIHGFVDTTGTLTAQAHIGKGIELWYQTQGAAIEDNTIAGMFSAGIGISDGSNDNAIRRNIITGTTGDGVNGGAGILITSFNDTAAAPPGGNTITQNAIYGNAGLGIDLDPRGPAFSATYVGNGVTANDAGDGDSGANALQNYPVITSTNVGAGTVTFGGYLQITSGGSFRIDFYGNDLLQAGGYYEGQRFLGSLDATDGGLNDADGLANGTITFSTTLNVVMAASDVVTATATRANAGFTQFFETSEFSPLGVLIVDTTADVIDGTVTSIAGLIANKGADGRISLREAILATNATANGAGPDRILFNIPEALVAGAHTITLTYDGPDANANADPLPIITDAVIIDGTSEPQYSGTPVVEIDGSGTPALSMGIEISAGGSTVRGLMINRMGADGISINPGADGNLIEGNYIGTDVTGTLDRGNNDDGIDVNSSNNIIRNNVVSGNNDDGIVINRLGAAAVPTDNVVVGNRIGTNAAGTAAIANSGYGVQIRLGATNNTIGGTTAAERNVISGHSGVNDAGVYVRADAGVNNVIQGNYIGTDVTGTGALGNYDGVLIEASSTTVAGNVISGNTDDGIDINGGDSNVVSGNYIGTNAAGTVALMNSDDGIDIRNGAVGNTIGGTTAAERNVISGNADTGVFVRDAGSTGNLIRGNYIGTDVTGNADLGNGVDGITVWGAPNTTIGGTASGAGNLISGNNGNGIGIALAGATGTVIQGNYIGVRADGTAALANTGSGIYAGHFGGNASGSTTIGGTAAGATNVISGNGQWGVLIDTSSNNLVQGNYIGTNADGDAAVGNARDGVRIQYASSGNTVGGAAAGAANVIGGNLWSGVAIYSADATGGDDSPTNNVVQGNRIGTNSAGDDLGNALNGVHVQGPAGAFDSPDNNVIGTTSAGPVLPEAGAGNEIAFNDWDGVRVEGGVDRTRIAGNSIHDNGLLGINLVGGLEDGFGTTSNDVTGTWDQDAGANRLQNWPELGSASTNETTFVTVGGQLRTLNGVYRLHFYMSTAADPSLHGEGAVYLGYSDVTVNGTPQTYGTVFFNRTITGVAVPVGARISATATDSNGNTSEFSIAILTTTLAPTIGNLDGDSLAYSEGAGAVVIDQGVAATVSDADSFNFDTGNLTVTIAAGEDAAEDVLAISTAGTITLSAGMTAGSTVTVGGTDIGTITSTGAGASDLVVTFNPNATPALVQELVRAITYQNTDTSDPTAGARTIRFTVNDGDGNTSGAADVTVTVSGVNDAPALATGSTLTYTENQAATAINTSITVNDVDNATLASATVTIGANYANGQDVLGFVNGAGMGNIAGSWDAGTGVLTLTSAGQTATVAEWQAALRAVTYVNSSNDPSTAARTVQFRVNDGTANSNIVSSTVNVTPVNDVPALNTSSPSWTEGDPPVLIHPGLVISDPDDTQLTEARVEFLNFPLPAYATGDQLSYNAGLVPGGVTVSGNGQNTGLIFTGTATVAEYQALLRSVTFENTTEDPTNAQRRIRLSVWDANASGGANGIQSFATILWFGPVTPVNDAPTIGNLDGDSLAYSEGTGAVVIDQVGVAATVVDPDSANFDAGTFTVAFTAGSDSAEDVLGIRNQGTGAGQIGVSGTDVTYGGTVIGTFAGGSGGADLVITFNANATTAAVQALVRNITYTNTDTATPTTGARTVQFVVTDGDGGTSTAVSATVTVSQTNDAPTIGANTGATVAEGAGVTVTSAQLSVTDVDNTPAQIVYTLTAVPANGTLYLNGTPLAVNDTFTQADINAGLLTYTHDGSETAADGFTFTVSDGAGGSIGATGFSFTVTATNDAPVNTVPGAQTVASGATLIFSSGNGNAITVSDVDASGNVEVQLNATNGTVTLNGTTGLAFSVGDGTADATMTFTGSIAAINTALNGLAFAPAAGYVGAGASLQIVTDDLGGSGAGGALTDSDTVAITVSGFDVSGTIYHDVDGDADVAEGGTLTFVNATVHLYFDDGDGIIDGGDGLVATTTTNGSGQYSFLNRAAGTYWVVVDSTTLDPGTAVNPGYDASWIWAEQTYGIAGAAQGAGFLGAAGALYGGRDANASDAASVVTTAEHVTRVALAGANETGVNAGFSFNVVTNLLGGDAQDDSAANRTVQGSLRQFIQNANAIDGDNDMRFVPALGVATNATDGAGNDWWRITITRELPQITDFGTTIDGTAYSYTDGTTMLTPNTSVVGYVGAVGLGADAIAGSGDETTLSGVQGPQLELVAGDFRGLDGSSGSFAGDKDDDVLIGLDIQANDATVRRIAIHGFGNDDTDNADLFAEGDIRVGASLAGDTGPNYTGTLIEYNVIGAGPTATTFADPGANNRSVNGVLVAGPDNGILRYNAIGFAGRMGAFITNQANGWTVIGNDIRGNAIEHDDQDGLAIGHLAGGATVTNNYFFQNLAQGLDLYRSSGGNVISNNTFEQNGQGVSETNAVRLYGTGNTVSYNLIQNTKGSGVVVVSPDDGSATGASTGNLISRNSFAGNGGNSIDLVAYTGPGAWKVENAMGDGVTPNDGATDANDGNLGLDSPVITSALNFGATTTVSGTAWNGAGPVTSVEVYRAAPGAGDGAAPGFGEGLQYLGTAAVVGGNWSLVISGLAIGDSLTAIAITAANDTSEFGANVAVTPGDVTPPTLASLSSTTAAGTYGLGAVIDVTATMSEAVQAGAQITVTLDTGDTVVLTAAANGTTLTGTYTVGAGDNSADLNVASFVINGVQDLAGNAMSSTAIPGGQNLADNEALVIDTTAPAAPSVPDLDAASDSGSANSDNLTNVTTPTFSGTAEPNATVSVYDGATLLGTTVATAGGTWTFTSGALAEGVHNISATATDAAGNTSPASGALAVTVDTSAPAAPAVTSMTADTGTAGDGITADNTLVFDGTAEPNATVTVYVNGNPVGTTVADGAGIWSFDYTGTPLADGNYTVTATATDAAGNTGPASAAFNLTVDSTAPAAPTVNGQVTNDTTPTITGTLGAPLAVGEVFTVTVNGVTYTNGDGNLSVAGTNWTLTIPPGDALVVDGTYPVVATVTDAAGNATLDASTNELVVDTTAPAQPGAPDLAAGSDTGASSSDDLTNDATPTLTGTAEPGSTVSVYDGAALLGTTVADGAGNWSFTTPVLGEGGHTITVTATDAAGNVSVASPPLAIAIDATAPTLASLTSSTAAGTYGVGAVIDVTATMSEAAQAGAQITVTLDTGDVVTLTAAANGTTLTGTYTVGAGDNSADLNVASFVINGVQDLAGNAMSSTAIPGGQNLADNEALVIDTTAPAQPGAPDLAAGSDTGASNTDDVTSDTTPTLSGGGAEPGSTITITSSLDGVLGTVVADGAGNWIFTPPAPLTDGAHTITVTATDGVGNVSPASPALVVTVDSTAPAAPTVNNVTSPTALPVLTGTATLAPGETLTVTVNGATYTVTPDAFGNWTLDLGVAVPTSGVLGPFVDLGVYPITATVTDLAGNATNAAGTVTIAINDAPVVTTSGGALAYVENDPATAVDLGLTVSDIDNATLASATIQITGGYVAGEDSLAFVSIGGITGSWNGATGTLALTGPATTADWQAVLRSVAYQNAAEDPNTGARTVTFVVDDGGLDSAPATATVNLAAVNDAPTLTANTLTLGDGATVTLGLGNLGAGDVDDAWTTLTYTVTTIANGQFELVAAPGVAVTSFTAAQIAAGQVRFVHDGSNLAPSYAVEVSDGSAIVGPFAATIVFSATPTTPAVAPAVGGDAEPAPLPGADTGPITLAAVTQTSVLPTTVTDVATGLVTTFLRSPSAAGGETGDANFAEATGPAAASASGGAVRAESAVLATSPNGAPDARFGPLRAEAGVIDTAAHLTEATATPMRASLEVGSAGDSFAEIDEDHRQIEIVLGTIRVSGIALSVGAVWWAARAAGLVASLLSTTPAWRHVDPLPVLGRDPETEDEDEDEAETDQDKRADEHRARWVLDEQPA